MDKILHHLGNPGMNDSPVKTNEQSLPMVSKWCRISSANSCVVDDWGRNGMGTVQVWMLGQA